MTTLLKHTLRLWRKNIAVTLMAIMAMAFGIGLVSTQFSLMNGVLLRGLPFEDAHRLMYLERLDPRTRLSATMPLREFTRFREEQHSFEDLGALATGHKTLSREDRLPERYRAAEVSANFHQLLRVEPVSGRGIQTSDAVANAARVVLLGHAIWQRDFSGSAEVLGSTLRLDGEPAVVIGVMPPEFHFPEDQELWVNLREDKGAKSPEVEIFGKLRQGVTPVTAQADLELLTSQLKPAETTGAVPEYLTRIVPFVRHYTGDEAGVAFLTMLAMGLGVLLLACANVANLTLALASRRERELSIRAAVGATRGQLIRQMLIESTLLATLGAIAGGIVTIWCTGLINRQMATAEAPFWYRAVIDWRVVVLMSVLTILAALATGLVPALRASRFDINHLLQAPGGGASGVRLGRVARWLVTFQVTISCALLGVTGILTKSVVSAQSLKLSFDSASYMAAPLELPADRFPTEIDRLRFFDALRTEIGALPGVDRITLTSRHPASRGAAARIQIQDHAVQAEDTLPLTLIEAVDSSYFETMHIPILQGRVFTETDRRGATAVAVVSQGFAGAAWPNENPVGKLLRRSRSGWTTVIGVVPDIPRLGVEPASRFPRVYFSHAQEGWERMVMLVETKQNHASQALAIRRIVDRLAAGLAAEKVETLSESLTEALKIPRLLGGIFLGAGAAAILLAAIGIFGVVSFSVSQRTRDFAIRMALGAQRRQVFALVVGQSLKQLLFGLGLGTVVGYLLGKPLASELIGVAAFDPVISLLVAGCVTAVAVIAIVLPARRATKADPIVALRSE